MQTSTPPTTPPASSRDTAYWNRLAEFWQAQRPHALWRQYSDALNGSLMERWLPDGQLARVLKTDLFDEAVSEGLYPLLATRATHVVAIDLSRVAAQIARGKYPGLSVVPADARHLPFADQSFDLILSNSTLDHFDVEADLSLALRELGRTLRPGGHLVLTMDNLDNPLVWLRNSLPAIWLGRLGVVPYKMGKTAGVHALQSMVRAAGLEVLRSTAILHSPRVLAVTAAAWLHRRKVAGVFPSGFFRILRAFERLEGLPTRYLTGHFVALFARKPLSSG